MYEESYQLAIDKIKETYPEFKDVRFDISDGELSWRYDSRYPTLDIGKLQQFVNDFLGQREYQVEYVAYERVYARSEEEAKEFGSRIKPKPFVRKAYETKRDR